MEMIAMLGGLGANSPYLENPSPAARAAKNAIAAAKTVDEVMAVKAGIPNMGLSTAEAATLQLIADSKITDLTTPFYRRPGYWLVVGAVAAAAVWHWPKIKSAFSGRGLSGLAEFDDAMNGANEAYREADKAWSRGKYSEAMEMVKLAESYIADAKRESGSDSFRKSLTTGLAEKVKDLRNHLVELNRPAPGRRDPGIPGLAYRGDSLWARRGFK